ncbi:MAG: hypothetical protein ACRBN8_20465 [Nannocystales bacterium]
MPERTAQTLTDKESNALRTAGRGRAATLKAVAVLHYAKAVALLLTSIGGFSTVIRGQYAIGAIMIATGFGLALIPFLAARWLFRLRPKGRIIATALAAVEFAALVWRAVAAPASESMAETGASTVVGALFVLAVLWVLWSPPSATVFSQRFRDAAMP